jgi:hypothetical protein
MNLGELQTSFSTILNRRDCTTAQRDEFIQQGIAWVQRKLRVPALRKAVEITTDSSNYVTGLTIPSDLIELDTITIQADDGSEWTLDRKALKEVLRSVNVTDLPRIFAQRGAEYILAPFPTAGTVIRIDYFAELAGLSASTDENVASIIAPYLLVYAALTYAGRNFTDKRRGEWETIRNEILQELHDQADEDELSGGAAVSPVYAWPSDD